MSTVVPENEKIKSALKWIMAEIEEDPRVLRRSLVERAVFSFDLSPKEAEFLLRFIDTLPVCEE